MLPMVASDPIFWLLTSVHVVLLIVQRHLLTTGGPGLPVLEWEAAILPVSLLTFFVVFYMGNCYTRFYQLFGCCVAMGGTMHEWVYLVKAHFRNESANMRWNLARTLLAAMHVHYAFLSGEKSHSKSISRKDWLRIQRHQLLSDRECSELASCKQHAARCFIPATWGLETVRRGLLVKLRERTANDALTEDDLLRDSGLMTTYSAFESCALTFRRNCAETLEIMNMPVPFAYFHATKLLLLSALGIISYSLILIEVHVEEASRMLWTELLSLGVFVIISGIMIGLHAIAVRMSDPFGEDDSDFNMDEMLSSAYNTAIEVLADTHRISPEEIADGIRNPLATVEPRAVAPNLTGMASASDEIKSPPARSAAKWAGPLKEPILRRLSQEIAQPPSKVTVPPPASSQETAQPPSKVTVPPPASSTRETHMDVVSASELVQNAVAGSVRTSDRVAKSTRLGTCATRERGGSPRGAIPRSARV